MERPKVLCIGHIAYDIIFTIDGYPPENSKVKATERSMSGGGPAANAACLCAAWGAETTWIGHVGDDPIGSELLSDFELMGVDASRAVVRPNHPTPLSAILVNRTNGSRTIINHRAPIHVRPDETSLIGLNPDVILIDGHEPILGRVALDVFPNAITVLDGGSLRELSVELAESVDYAVVSEVFAMDVSGMNFLENPVDKQRCTESVQSTLRTNTAVTFGEHGTWFVDGTGSAAHIPALDVRPVDTTAAGDLFHGAFCWAMAQTYSFEESLRLATVAAGLSVSIPGGRASIPDLTKVLRTVTDLG